MFAPDDTWMNMDKDELAKMKEMASKRLNKNVRMKDVAAALRREDSGVKKVRFLEGS